MCIAGNVTVDWIMFGGKISSASANCIKNTLVKFR